MENHEQTRDGLPEKDRAIQLVVNQADQEEDSIDLGNVFRNMKNRKRLFAWVLVLCLTVGVCAPLLLYQFTKAPMEVTSLVTLQYDVPVKVRKLNPATNAYEMVIPDNPSYIPVTDLTAPDGSDLDLNQITSSYVLQTVLDGVTLSHPLTVDQLRSNISIRTILTEDSRKTREALAGYAELKNAEAYNRLQSTDMTYQNRFTVTLSNSFGDEDSNIRFDLTDEELKMVLDRVLSVYNEYLVTAYADVKLPGDPFTNIDPEDMEPQDVVSETRSGVALLYSYCEEKPDAVKTYRSWRTGRSLTDWMETLETFREISVGPFYAQITKNGIARDKGFMLNTQKYLLRNAKSRLTEINESIGETNRILATYKNDEIYVSMQESDTARTTRAATDQYNEIVLLQKENYRKAAELKAEIADTEERIRILEGAGSAPVTDETLEEMDRMVSTARGLYSAIRAHMEEVFASPMFATYEYYSAPQGKEQNFLAANVKKIVIGAVAGVVIACGLWFLAGLVPEFSKGRKEQETGKEAEAK